MLIKLTDVQTKVKLERKISERYNNTQVSIDRGTLVRRKASYSAENNSLLLGFRDSSVILVAPSELLKASPKTSTLRSLVLSVGIAELEEERELNAGLGIPQQINSGEVEVGASGTPGGTIRPERERDRGVQLKFKTLHLITHPSERQQLPGHAVYLVPYGHQIRTERMFGALALPWIA
uniref:Uncharacterized protein n=1 Tax=Peronospora matthiolae TaxID=2874970 RepID=A0AAV1VC17_9STRA